MIETRIQTEIFDSGKELAPLEKMGVGAVASFTGIARQDKSDLGNVTAIELEHFPGMTEKSLRDLAQHATKRWDLLGSVLIHRVGRIEAGEPIVLVGTAALHRAEALDACSFLIDKLKSDAPFWKKEFREDGSGNWVEAKSSDDARADKWD